jgi:Domain of unknown function (DUF4268)
VAQNGHSWLFWGLSLTSVIPLGTIERVPLKQAWPTEDGNFTPWLAQVDAISVLGEALNLELEVEAIEHWVGSFRADILARAIDEADHRVIIENQFGRTNHNHLGQILTYLAGIEGAKSVVWIAETIQPDHRAAIDWLNTNTSEDFSFFAIEIELWRIANSPPAPRFNVIASPNDWTRTARTATRQVGERVLADRHRVRLAYWASFAEYLKEKGSTFRIRRPNKDHWFSFAIGRSGFVISATISTDKQRIGVELFILNDVEKAAFHSLLAEKQAIETEFGEALEWQELPGKKGSRIALFKLDVDPSDEKQYPELHAWMLAKMDRFKKVFAARVKSLSLNKLTTANGDEAEDD